MKRQAKSRSVTTSATPEPSSSLVHADPPAVPVTQERSPEAPAQDNQSPLSRQPNAVEGFAASIPKPRPRPRRQKDTSAPETRAGSEGLPVASIQPLVEENIQTVKRRRGRPRKNPRPAGKGEQPDSNPLAKKRKFAQHTRAGSMDEDIPANAEVDSTLPSSATDGGGRTTRIAQRTRRSTRRQDQAASAGESSNSAHHVDQQDENPQPQPQSGNAGPEVTAETFDMQAPPPYIRDRSRGSDARRRGRGQKNQVPTRRSLRSATRNQALNDHEDLQGHADSPASQGSSSLTSLSSGSP